jgi:EmrB/QacA subfamily drug resistance transporter
MTSDDQTAPGSAPAAGRPPPPPDGERSARVVLAVVATSSLLVPFLSSATNVALPEMGAELGIDAPLLPWVNTSYMLASAALLLPLGRLVDLRGKRAPFVWGVSGLAVLTAIVPLAPSGGWLLALRALQGALGAFPLAASMPLLVASWPPEKRGRALGVLIAGVYSGLSLGPVLGGVLTHAFGWRSIFYLTAAAALVIGLVAAGRLPPDPPQRTEGRLDLPGSLLSGLALCTLMLGLARVPTAAGFGLLATSGAALVGFGLRELRAPSPLLDLRLFARNRSFLFSNLAALVNYSATAGVGLLLSLYLQRLKGFDPRGAGLVLVVQPALMALLSAPAGRLSERVEPRLLATAGMLLTAAGLAVLALVGPTTPTWLIVVALAVLGVAFALFSSPNTNAVMNSVERHQLGVASATLGTMRSVGQMLSLGVCGLLFELFIGHQPIATAPVPAFVQALRVAFGLFAALCFLGAFASRARGRMHG